jgi:hypothetical protein
VNGAPLIVETGEQRTSVTGEKCWIGFDEQMASGSSHPAPNTWRDSCVRRGLLHVGNSVRATAAGG